MDLSVWALERELLFDAAGLLGVLIYVCSYSALQFDKLDGNSLQYCLLNGSAATLVLISLVHDFNLASAIIQVVWISVSLFGLLRFLQRKRETKSLVISSKSLQRNRTRLRRRTERLTA
jgi:predicted membrane protein